VAKPDAIKDREEGPASISSAWHDSGAAALTVVLRNPDKQTQASPAKDLRRYIRILADLGRLAGESADVEGFLDQSVFQIARAVGIQHVKVLRYRPQTADLLVAAGVGWKNGVVRTATLPADLRSPPGRAFQTAEPVTIENFDAQNEYVLSDFLKEHGIVSLTNVPILIDGAAWGVLEVDSTKPRRFGEDSTDFLTAASALIGAFIQHHSAQPHEIAHVVAATQAQSRDVLLRELQHRVRNNFQLILGSISIQKRRYSTGEAQRALDYVASLINAISLAHDQLTPRHDGKIVRLSDYVRALCSSIRQQAEKIEVDVAADELELAIDRAVPLGLILNELATNSIKHAFSSDGGIIKVTLVGAAGYGEGRLTISDNGKGIIKSDRGGSGLKLIASLARQIGGTVDQDSSNRGTTTTVVFPLIA
jgi:two-component sensor histidine kinase